MELYDCDGLTMGLTLLAVAKMCFEMRRGSKPVWQNIVVDLRFNSPKVSQHTSHLLTKKKAQGSK